MGRNVIWLVIIVPLILLHSCKTVQVPEQSAIEVAEGDARMENNKIFDCCKMRLRATVRLGGTSLPATGVLQVKDGQWMSCSFRVPLLGIEIVRVEADADTLLVVNRYDKSYVKVPMSVIRAHTGLDYHSLQSLLMNDYFSHDGARKPRRDGTAIGEMRDGMTVRAENDRRTTLTFVYDGMARVVSTTVDVPPAYSMTFGYSDFSLKQDRYYPGKVSVSVTDGRHAAALDLQCTSVDFAPFEPSPAVVGGRYRQVKLSDILSTLHF